MNVAKYLNGDWEPNWNDLSEPKWYISYNPRYFKLNTNWAVLCKLSSAYFKSEELALQAIEILGEEEVKKALGIFE